METSTGRTRLPCKPKWWNIDWVELGCRGWDINVEGACYGEQKAMRARFDSCFVHLDRDTLGLHIHGHPRFVARVLTDLVAAKVFRFGPGYLSTAWNMTMDVGGITEGTNTSDNTTTGNAYWLRLVS